MTLSLKIFNGTWMLGIRTENGSVPWMQEGLFYICQEMWEEFAPLPVLLHCHQVLAMYLLM